MQDKKKDYIWNTLGVLLQNAISPLLLVSVTRINGFYDSGVFSFAFSIALVFWSISVWGGRTYQVSDVRKEFSDRGYVAQRVVLGALVFVAACLFVVISNYDITKSFIIISLVVVKITESIADALYGVMQVNNRLFKAGYSLIYRAVLGFGLFLLIDAVTNNLLISCLAIMLINIMILITYDLRQARRFMTITKGAPTNIHGHIKEAKAVTTKTFFVFLVLFLGMLPLNIPRYFLDKAHPEQITHFGIFAMPITLVSVIVLFIIQPSLLGLSKQYAKKNKNEFFISIMRFIKIAAVIGLLTIIATHLIGVEALAAIFNIDSLRYKNELMIMVCGAVINSIVAIYIIMFTIMRRIRELNIILSATNIILLMVCLAFSNNVNMMNASLMFTTISLAQFVLLSIMVYKIKSKSRAV